MYLASYYSVVALDPELMTILYFLALAKIILMALLYQKHLLHVDVYVTDNKGRGNSQMTGHRMMGHHNCREH